MTQVRIDRIGEWYLVIVTNPGHIYDPSIGTRAPVDTIVGTFRDERDAYDLKQALQRCAAGDLKQTVWSDLPMDDE